MLRFPLHISDIDITFYRRIRELQDVVQTLEKYGDVQSICAKLDEHDKLKKVRSFFYYEKKQWFISLTTIDLPKDKKK